MSGYIGASPVPQATQHRQAFTATASQTSFATVGYTPQFVDVYLNGVKLAAADYTATNGSDIVLTTGAALDDILEYVAYTPFEVADQTFTGTTTTDVLTTTGAFTSLGIDDNATSTAITIDASENVGIGTATPDEKLHLSGAGGQTIRIENTTTSLFGGSVIGSIEFEGNDTDASGVAVAVKAVSEGATGTAALAFDTGTAGSAAERMRINSNGALLHGTITAGSAGAGDIVVDGGVYLGGSAAANYLDDYEEGTFNLGCNVGTCTTVSATYTKVGDLVTVIAQVNAFSNTGVATNVTLIGLPFAVSGHGVGTFFAKGMTQTTEHAVYAGGTNLTFYGTYSVADYDPLKYTDMTANSEFYLSVTYKAA